MSSATSPDKLLLGALFFILVLTGYGCNPKEGAAAEPDSGEKSDVKFTLLSPDSTGLTFANNIPIDYEYNNFVFEYIYNGGGVAAGDVNGDTLPDLYFSASRLPNRLFINLGHWKFLDVTEASGLQDPEGFKTGVAMADINGDGLLDIYSCKTSKSDNLPNADKIFINQGVKLENGVRIPLFKDLTLTLGLADQMNTNHACFFDFDRDGDLDFFQLNHRTDFDQVNSLRLEEGPDGKVRRKTKPESPTESNKFYENVNGVFKDITQKAGMESSAFGLSATPCDINQDGWMDLYIANDFMEPDVIFINNRNGTFSDQSNSYLKHMSQSSMGSDVGDINNDALPDIVVMDMKPEDPFRYKEMMNNMQYDRYNLMVQYGYGRQPGRNVLQLNTGNGQFNEIGQYAGMAATDWSWGAIFADFNNDGWKDLFVTNGYRKDLTQQDYFTYFRDSISRTGGLSSEKYPDIRDFLKYLPEKQIPNYLYINSQKLSFINATTTAGMQQPSFSSGFAYADLDMDGDMDIIVNNIDAPAFLYRNDTPDKRWIQIDLIQDNRNTDGLGSVVDIYAAGLHQQAMMSVTKGYYSSSEPLLHFGLGDASIIDSIWLTWPDGTMERLVQVQPNQRLYWKKGMGQTVKRHQVNPPSSQYFAAPSPLAGWSHHENAFVDFKRERLLPYMISAEGPCLATGDANGDGLRDVFAGNGNGHPSGLFIQQKDMTFLSQNVNAFIQDSIFEDCDAVFRDFDKDGDEDLVVVSGGAAYDLNDPAYMSRYYVNQGNGQFRREASFPIIRTNAGAVLALDYDGDGDEDIIVGGRSTPGYFPKSPRSFLLENDGGRFKDVTKDVAPDLVEAGMITDIKAGDLNGDGQMEIILAGDWMPVTILQKEGKLFVNKTKSFGLQDTQGWWKSLLVEDIDGDGDMDIVAGNLGLNHRLKTSAEYPITLVAKDFDGNGSIDPVTCFYYEGKLYPFAGRDALIAQVPMIKKRFLRYTPYSRATLQDIFTADELKDATYLYSRTFETTWFRNEGKSFTAVALPYQVQLSPVNDILCHDFNGDGKKDLLMAGNFSYAETETGEIDAGNGVLLIQDQSGQFRYIDNREHGFWAQKEARDMEYLPLEGGNVGILVANNKGPLELSLVKSKKN